MGADLPHRGIPGIGIRQWSFIDGRAYRSLYVQHDDRSGPMAVSRTNGNGPSDDEHVHQRLDGPGPSGSCWDLLEDYTRLEFRQTAGAYTNSQESRARLRKAFLEAVITKNDAINWHPGSSPVLLGVLSSDVRLALRSLRDFTAAFGTKYTVPDVTGTVVPLPQIRGPVYIRYRSIDTTVQCTLTPYSGNDRGVLVSFGTMQIGHLPLGLLDEGMTVPFDTS